MRCTNSPVYGVILAGGEGQRLWPISRKKFPKYCIRIGSSRRSLIQQAYDRLRIITTNDKIFVVTQKAQSHLIKRQLSQLDNKNIIVEPFGRNTAAAIGLAAVIIGRQAPDAVMVVVPADQFMPASEKNVFDGVARMAIRFACTNNSLITVAVKPTYPSVGFGYIKPVVSCQPFPHQRDPVIGTVISKRYQAYKVERFVEKPDLAKAKRFLKSGYLWNAGIFVWEVTAILEAIRDYLPKLCRALARIDKGILTTRYNSVLSKVYKKLDNISIDYGVLEKSKNVFVVPANIKWDDVGSWLSFIRMFGCDKDGNLIDANFKGIDTKNCIIISKDKGHLLATYGLKDVIIVKTADATLVCSKDKAEKLKDLVYVSEDCFR